VCGALVERFGHQRLRCRTPTSRCLSRGVGGSSPGVSFEDISLLSEKATEDMQDLCAASPGLVLTN
jgi:hypothetical protein